MDQAALSFEQILNTTVRMLSTSWKVKRCMFLQTDDLGNLKVRAANGVPGKEWQTTIIQPGTSPVARCLSKNHVTEITSLRGLDGLVVLMGPSIPKNQKYVLIPVSGEVRVLGMLILGPFPKSVKVSSREAELRSAGALCAVLSAQWRLYEWISSYLPQVNHELRTPLTAIQGSLGMVLGGMFGQVGDEVRAMLEMAHKGCERTVRAIEEYLNSQKMPQE